MFAVDLGAVTLTMALSSALAGALYGHGILGLGGTTLAMAGAAAMAALAWAVAMRRLGARLETAAEEQAAEG